MQIADFLEALVRDGPQPVGSWPTTEPHWETYGLVQEGGAITLQSGVEVLSEHAVRENLSASAVRWLETLEIHRAIPSTNVRLMDQAASGSVTGSVCLAELQTAGRGRRGRRWMSPFAKNLALSLGLGSTLPATELGGLSLAVGLAAADCLDSFGVSGVTLKWPNDVYLDGRKLGGILLELASATPVQVVVGIGLNLEVDEAVRRQIDQPVADLVSRGHRLSRNALAGRLASSIVDYAAAFDRAGFAPMRFAFDELHEFHGRPCRLVSGTEEITGTVLGVSDNGALRLATAAGEQAFISGEVSLREA